MDLVSIPFSNSCTDEQRCVLFSPFIISITVSGPANYFLRRYQSCFSMLSSNLQWILFKCPHQQQPPHLQHHLVFSTIYCRLCIKYHRILKKARENKSGLRSCWMCWTNRIFNHWSTRGPMINVENLLLSGYGYSWFVIYCNLSWFSTVRFDATILIYATRQLPWLLRYSSQPTIEIMRDFALNTCFTFKNASLTCSNVFRMVFQWSGPVDILLVKISHWFVLHLFVSRLVDIGLDQAIECSINRFGKSQGGISGHFSDIAIDIWCNSFGYRAELSRALHEICGMPSNADTLDAHLECSPNQQAIDSEDLSIIVAKLRKEQIFDKAVQQCRKLSSGRVIHDEIVDDICDLFRRGQLELIKLTDNRLVGNFEGVDDTIKKMPRLSRSTSH